MNERCTIYNGKKDGGEMLRPMIAIMKPKIEIIGLTIEILGLMKEIM
jgi:hypothetical protein